MAKGKPRHDPNKKQNKYGSNCSYYERPNVCEAGLDAKVCGGNPHHCIKERYRLLASISMDGRWKING